MKNKGILFGAAALVLAGTVIFGITKFSSSRSESLDPDTVSVIWINDDLDEIDLTDHVNKDKIVDLLGDYNEKNRENADTDRPEPKKGDLGIRVKDHSGEEHDFYLSHENGEYFYDNGEEAYSIPDGEKLYQEIAAEL